MPRDFSNVINPVMVYSPDNTYTIIESDQVDAALAAGWSAEPVADIYTPVGEHPDTVDFTAVAPKSKKKTPAAQE